MSTGNLGRHFSEEHKAKLSAAHKGRVVSAETRAKIGVAGKGRIMSLETRAKMSAGHMGKPSHLQLPESRAKISAAHKGKSTYIRTPEILIEMSLAQRGSKGSNWKGGLTPENETIRHSPEYIAWRTAVFERDDFTCQDCEQHGGYLEAHHIHEFSKYPDERFVVDNGKTLCLKCHNKTKPGRPRVIAMEG